MKTTPTPCRGFRKITALLSLSCLFTGFQLRAQFAGGNGTAANPYKISTAQQLDSVRNHLTSSFILTADIDLSTYLPATGNGWLPIGDYNNYPSSALTGNFDGGGHVISGLWINRPLTTDVGLFGNANANISNLGVEVAAGKSVIGGNAVSVLLAGQSGGTITNCYAKGDVIANNYAGGLLGIQRGNISKCYATGSISSSGSSAGGLVGYEATASGSTISNSYAICNVNGTGSGTYVGGLVGYNNDATISNCYAADNISGMNVNIGGLIGVKSAGSVTACFYDNTLTNKLGVGNGSQTGVNGQNTTQMQTQSTFTNAGWDFVNIWTITPNNYPTLKNMPKVVAIDSVTVNVVNNAPPVINSINGTLYMQSKVYPANINQNVIWSIVPGTGNATVSATGMVTALAFGTVYVKAVSVQDTTKEDSIKLTISNQTSGIANVAGNALSMYPNPVTKQLALYMGANHPALKLTITDMQGKIVLSRDVEANKLSNPYVLSLESLNGGVYFLRLAGDGVDINNKIIKQ